LCGQVVQCLVRKKNRNTTETLVAVGCAAGGLFDFVSCPHYLAEIVIYLGLFITSQGQLMPLLMLVWVVSRLLLLLLLPCMLPVPP
jgi:steroid 5-alpha reductase family enzyme